jgi:hypothetical protein
MTGLVRKATLLTAAGLLLLASAALANVPSAANSTAPDIIRLVGNNAGVPDPGLPAALPPAPSSFTVVVKDLANNPISNASVVVDLSLCGDLAICNDQLDANALVNCGAKTTRKFSDVTGSVSFIVLGGSNGAGNAIELHNAGRIFANGTLLRSPTVAAYDLDGQLGIGASDLSAWLGDFANGSPYGRPDYDGDGSTGSGDLSLWLGEFAGGNSTSSCALACP